MKQIVLMMMIAIQISLSGRIFAQEISLDGEYRINPVYSRGFREPMYQGDKAGFFTMQRTRLIFNYNKENDLDAEVILQDRRFWGDQSDREDLATLSIFRAWVEKYFTKEFSIRLGRQGFIYDEQHLLGDPNWVGTRAHDAALVKYETESWKAHFAVAYNANGQELKREAYDHNMYKSLQFLWLHKDFKKLNLSFIVINRGMEKGDTTSAFTQTFGPDVTLTISDKLSLKGLYYYQVGKNVNNLDVNANFFSAQLIYDLSDKVNFILGVDAGSGTDQADLENPDNKKSHSFDRHYGLLHGHFGYMDYFYVNNPTLVGAHDYYLKTKVNAGKKLSFEDHMHSFATSATLNDPLVDGKKMNHNLGLENDFLVHYKLSSVFKATLGHSIMFGTPTLDQFFGGRKSKENQVVYAVITASPNFFKTKTDK
jgi:Alginate export